MPGLLKENECILKNIRMGTQFQGCDSFFLSPDIKSKDASNFSKTKKNVFYLANLHL